MTAFNLIDETISITAGGKLTLCWNFITTLLTFTPSRILLWFLTLVLKKNRIAIVIVTGPSVNQRFL